MRVYFTGGGGKAGRHAIHHLVDCGHRVVNGDMVPLGEPGVAALRIDLTEPGQVFNALSAYVGFDELEPGTDVPRYDAVVYFAAIPAILVRPDNETFRINVLSTYNVIDAAVKLGIPRVVFASSETNYGICFADGEVNDQISGLMEPRWRLQKVARWSSRQCFASGSLVSPAMRYCRTLSAQSSTT